MAHCWYDYRSYLVEIGKEYTSEWAATYTDGNKTCMRENNHDGDHDFVDDSLIVVQFPE